MPGDRMKKRAEELSVVPDFIREKFRESQRNKTPPMRTMPQERGDNMPEEERMRLREMIGEEPQRFAMGGMVKGYAKGGSVMPRGYGKARSKPCKLS